MCRARIAELQKTLRKAERKSVLYESCMTKSRHNQGLMEAALSALLEKEQEEMEAQQAANEPAPSQPRQKAAARFRSVDVQPAEVTGRPTFNLADAVAKMKSSLTLKLPADHNYETVVMAAAAKLGVETEGRNLRSICIEIMETL
jgi:hypothetical protein